MSHIGLGKIILLGEHAVVYGYPALAAALDRGVTIDAVPTPAGGPLRVDVPSWNVKLTADDDHSLARGLCAIADALELGRPPLSLIGDAQIPPGAGLGASAAFAVAIARALLAHLKKPTDAAAVDARPRARARPSCTASASGVDVALAVARRHRRVPQVDRAAHDSDRSRCACSSAPAARRARRPAMVERVARRRPRGSVDDARLRELGSAHRHRHVVAARAAISRRSARDMNRAHELLGGLGVSTPLLDALCDVARKLGAYGAKLTGAGGGGAVIAIAPRDKEDDILAAWKTRERATASSRRSAADDADAPAHGHRARVREHRARQVLGQARRGAEPAGGGQPVADARRARHRDDASTFDPRARATTSSMLDGAPADAEPRGPRSFSTSCARAPASTTRARVVSRTDFPTASGLASSASGFAALALAATRAGRARRSSPRELSILARRGSGSAARSIFGGLRAHARRHARRRQRRVRRADRVAARRAACAW